MLRRCLVFALCAVLSAPALAGGWGGRYHHGAHYGYRHHGGDDEGAALLAGLLIGGVVGYFLSEDRYYRRHAYHYEPPRYYGYASPRYRHETYRPVERVRVVRAEPPSPYAAVPTEPEFAGHVCRMTREYATTLEVDGREREAYGTKCLTPDGSWILGRARLVPEFD